LAGGVNNQIQYNNRGVLNGFTMSGDVTVVPTTGVATVANGSVTWSAVSGTHAKNTAETTAGITPTNYGYLPGDIRRYGGVADGVYDNNTPIDNARIAANPGTVYYGGNYYASGYWENLAPLVSEYINGSPTNYQTTVSATKPVTWAKQFVGQTQSTSGYGHYVTAVDSYTLTGVDVQSGAAGIFRMNSYSTNSLNSSFNKTNQVALVANASALSTSASASVEAFNAIAASLYTGSLAHIVVGVEADISASNPPGFFGGASTAYSVGVSSNWVGGLQNGTIGVSVSSSNATYGWLHSGVFAGSINTGLTVTRNGTVSPDSGIWIASAATFGIYIGAKAKYAMNPGQTADYTYQPVIGLALGQTGATSANSQKFRFIATNGSSAEINYDVYLNSSGLISFDYNGTAKFGISSDGYVYIQNTLVVNTRKTGYTAMAGSVDRSTSFNTGTVTLTQLAQRVAALQADLTSHGLIGA
jgi:hypothetical protein